MIMIKEKRGNYKCGKGLFRRISRIGLKTIFFCTTENISYF
ncbi:Hypothetical protein Minf_2290 [Methylacidiphilum infernorum V4]|uniref:Uncharacterized protein n=1 Tax=Methylacidiphilum infernorum (isolate V4) TaxID=481448 RepID=B3E0B5_METI4|nr:Hypothetical protein Minf_2290 [Methylacidiphilum infernorum V4]